MMMASLHMVSDPVLTERVDVRPPRETAPSRQAVKEAILKVLQRAANDPGFIAQMTYKGSYALQDYALTQEAKAALVSGDINWVESYIGKLDERLSTWFYCRLAQEIW